MTASGTGDSDVKAFQDELLSKCGIANLANVLRWELVADGDKGLSLKVTLAIPAGAIGSACVKGSG